MACEYFGSFILSSGYNDMYFANSMTASVACGLFSFFTRRMLRGGDGQWRDSKSLPFVSASVSFGT